MPAAQEDKRGAITIQNWNHESNETHALEIARRRPGVEISYSGIVFSAKQSMNSDGINHVYSPAYSGDIVIPAGTFVAFEDLPFGGDFNYQDENFVFTNVATATNIPEPASLALFGLGIGGIAFNRRKRAISSRL